VLAGDGTGYPTLAGDLAASGVGDRVHVTGYLDDEAVASCLAAADVCLCLRWPTAQETSASWLQCLAAARPTVLTDLAHQVDIPSLDPVDWRPFPASADPVAVRIAVLDEEKSLRTAMSRLARDGSLRDRLSRAGHAYWSAHHTLATAAGEYRRLIRDAVQRPAPAASDLPAHFTDDYSTRAAQIAARFGIAFEDLWAGRAG
jgi:glycosyltransferase involved in cell wall biosynthesis